MKLLANQILILFLLVVFMTSCNSNIQESVDGKNQLENGIRGKVKFLDEPEILTSISDQMRAYNIPALSLAVINQGEIEWAEVYQNPDFSGEQTLDNTSIFQAASLSKPVTFMAALRMYTAGEIDLDKNIQDYLKDYQLPDGKQTVENPVTFRNIFSHTSGISPGGYKGYDRNQPMPSDIDILRGSEGVNTPAIEVIASPNKRLSYSGGGYTLAELALQDYFNDSFANLMNQWILEPAGMNHSEFTQPLPSSDSLRVAKGHTFSGTLVEGGWRNHPEQAAAGLWSNASDLAKFLNEIYRAYHGKSSIFSRDEITTILSQEREGHVYGFIINRTEDDITITHYGGNMGYRTGMTISLINGKGLVYLANSDNGGLLGNELLLSASQIYGWSDFKQENVYREEVSDDILKGLEGKYIWNRQIPLSITYNDHNKSISLFFPNGDEYQLSPIKGEELDFIHPNTGVRVSFSDKDYFQSFSLYHQTATKIEPETDGRQK